MLIGIAPINSYAVVAIVMVLGAIWIAAMVFYNTQAIITIVAKNQGDNYRILFHKETKVEFGIAHGDGESIRISGHQRARLLPPSTWKLADQELLKLMHAHVLRQKDGEYVVLISRKHLPEEIGRWYDAGRRKLYS